MIREKLNGNETAAPNGTENSLDAGADGQINLSDFMITGRELLSRRGSQQSRKEYEIRQDLVHQRLFFYSIETFSKNKSGPIAEFSYLTADEDLNELEGRSGRFLMALPPDVLPDPVCAAAAGISPSEAQRTGLRENEFAERILSVLPTGSAGTMSASPMSASARFSSGHSMIPTSPGLTAMSEAGSISGFLRVQPSRCALAR